MILGKAAAHPTLETLFALMDAVGLDRVSLVRETLPDRAPGVLIVMRTQAAVEALTPIIQRACAPLRFRNDKHLPLKLDEDLTRIFAWLEAAELDCIATGLRRKVGDGPAFEIIILHAIVGPAVTDELCQELTAAGCQTSLK